MITLDNFQNDALDRIIDWFQEKNKAYFSLGGFAGTGKTTLIVKLREVLFKKSPKIKVSFIAYSAKASRVLAEKLKYSKAIHSKDFVGTIHSLIYRPLVNSNEEIIGWELKDELNYDLIIVDEASMVDEKIWKDLLSFKIPILAVGDHGQLPPISGKFNLMEKTDLKLETIHRQAEKNPIIKLSMIIRSEGIIKFGKYSSGVEKISKVNPDTQDRFQDEISKLDEDTLLLCGMNFTRIRLNNSVRASKEFEKPSPIVGDKVICLRNNYQKQVFNGMTGKILTIESDSEEAYFAKIQMDDNSIFSGLISSSQFNAQSGLNFTPDRKKIVNYDLFDFGYATTVHKAQGSQSRKVILFEERFSKMSDQDFAKWLYTGVTRAEEELLIIG